MKPFTDLEGSEDLQEADKREDHESPGPQQALRELVASVHEPQSATRWISRTSEAPSPSAPHSRVIQNATETRTGTPSWENTCTPTHHP